MVTKDSEFEVNRVRRGCDQISKC